MIKQQAESKSPHPPFAKGGRGGISSESGFTLIELLITMVIFVLVLAAGSQIFTELLTQFKQQSKIAETNIEGIVGLEILKQDIEHAGYGLPWNGLITYSEASGDPFGLNDSPTGAPKAIVSQNNASFSSPNNIFDDSDYLVIKAVNVARNSASQKWTKLQAVSPYVRTWTPSSENLSAGDHVIVLSTGATDINRRTLVVNGAAFSTTYSSVTSSPWSPTDVMEARIIYGVDPDTGLRMPFNRADYYIRRFNASGDNITPQRCARNTGVLEKVAINQSDGQRTNFLPLLDCVADMQVVYGIDTDATIDGAVNCYANNLADVLATVDAENIRNRIKEVRVYLLAHEGQYDRSFAYNPPISPSSIRVGEPSANLPGGSCTGEAVLGRDFNLSGITNWQHYRWKVYTMVLKPNNLR